MPETAAESTEAAAPQGLTFRERKAAEIKAERERGEQPVQMETVEAPPEDEGSVQDDGYPELHDEADAVGEEAEAEEDLDEAPSEDEDDAGSDQDVNWEKRYKDTQVELERLRVRDSERDSEVADQLSGAVQLHHELEDQLSKAKSYTEFYVQGLDQQMQQLQNAFNTGMIEPDKLPEARQQYQQLALQRQMLDKRIEQVDTERQEAEKTRKKREAEIARVRLQRTIPGWGKEKYAELRQAAMDRGYTAEEFGNITDHRYFELLHDSVTLRSTDQTIENVQQTRRSKPPPRGKGRVSTQSRDSRGRFEKLKREFNENPNQPGRFAAMKAEQLRRERRGR